MKNWKKGSAAVGEWGRSTHFPVTKSLSLRGGEGLINVTRAFAALSRRFAKVRELTVRARLSKGRREHPYIRCTHPDRTADWSTPGANFGSAKMPSCTPKRFMVIKIKICFPIIIKWRAINADIVRCEMLGGTRIVIRDARKWRV